MLAVVVSSTELVVEGGYGEEPVWASDDELGLDDDVVVWARELEVDRDVSDVWVGVLESELVYEEVSASVVSGIGLVLDSV